MFTSSGPFFKNFGGEFNGMILKDSPTSEVLTSTTQLADRVNSRAITGITEALSTPVNYMYVYIVCQCFQPKTHTAKAVPVVPAKIHKLL